MFALDINNFSQSVRYEEIRSPRLAATQKRGNTNLRKQIVKGFGRGCPSLKGCTGNTPSALSSSNRGRISGSTHSAALPHRRTRVQAHFMPGQCKSPRPLQRMTVIDGEEPTAGGTPIVQAQTEPTPGLSRPADYASYLHES